MRFSVAAAILACQALPTASLLDEKKEGLAAISGAWTETSKKIVQEVSPKVAQHRERKAQALEKRRLGKGGPLGNNRLKEKKEEVECDPNAPDQGILACGNNRYCAESQTSSAGGVCSSRRLQSCSVDNPCPNYEFCNLDFGDEGTCELCPCGDPSNDCYGLNLPNYAGEALCAAVCVPDRSVDVECQNVPFCGYRDFNYTTGVGTYYCSSYTCDYGYCCLEYYATAEYGENGYYKNTFSYYFTNPYSQNFTLSYNSLKECEMTLDGTMCASCEIVEYENEFGGNTTCYEFDCTNANPNAVSGNTCEGAYAFPIYNYCVGNSTNTTSCNICGDGSLLYANATVGLPGTPYQVPCYQLYGLGLYGYLTPDECAGIELISGPTCCSSNATICSLCPDDAPPSNPDMNLTLGDLTATCAEVQQFGLLGLIPPELCPLAKGAFPALCGCDVGVLPTEPPVSMPTEPPVPAPTEPPVPAPTEPPAPMPTEPPVEESMPTEPPVVEESMVPAPVDSMQPTESGASYYSGLVSLVGLSLTVAALHLVA